MYISNFHSKKSGTQISISSYLYHKNRYIHLHDNSVVGNGKTSICYIHNNVVNINKKISLTNVPLNINYIFSKPRFFLGGDHSSKSVGTSGQCTSLRFCLCVNFPFNASSCNLSQRVASSLTLSQKTNSPGLGESNKPLNSLLYRSMTLFVRWCLS